MERAHRWKYAAAAAAALAGGAAGFLVVNLARGGGGPWRAPAHLLLVAAGLLSLLCWREFERRRVVAELERRAVALRDGEERLSLALAAADTEVWDWDLRADAFHLGAGWAARLGLDTPIRGGRDQVLARIVHPDDQGRVGEAIAAQELAGSDGLESEHRVLLADGGTRWIHVCGRVSERDAAGAPVRYVGTVRDVTDAKALQARLERADRLASLGTLAAGIAHEVNNPAAYVAANLAFVRDELARGGGADADVRTALDEALAGVRRVGEIVAGLKRFARPGAHDAPAPIDVRAEIAMAVDMTRHEVERRARLALDLAPELPTVVARGAELGQVLVDLLANAAHAIPEGRAAEHEVRVTARVEGGHVTVEVRDSGVGIPPEVLPRVFDPFFTTRPVGGGTGLGLSICHGIVTALGGTIEVESAPGRGSVFRVSLPAHAAPREPESAVAPERPAAAGAASGPPLPPGAASSAPPAPAGAARVLVVDDEPLVGRAIARVLVGHDVTVTSSAADALARLVGGERYDVVLCDLMMPGIDGMELEGRLAATAPDVLPRLVFMTGGAFTPAARAFLDAGRTWLEKPIDRGALRDLVARSLAGGRAIARQAPVG